MRKRIQASKNSIAAYWTASGMLGSDFEGCSEMSSTECFACRYRSERLDRAHILADCLGGLPTEENLHLLCATCHAQSEMLDGDIYWAWIRKRRSAPKADPLRKYIRTMREDFNIDFFQELHGAIEQAEDLQNLRSRIRAGLLMQPASDPLDGLISDRQRKQALEALEHIKQWVESEGDV